MFYLCRSRQQKINLKIIQIRNMVNPYPENRSNWKIGVNAPFNCQYGKLNSQFVNTHWVAHPKTVSCVFRNIFFIKNTVVKYDCLYNN